MSVYRMESGDIVNTEKATATYEEATDFDGRNRISRATGDQWTHEQLYRSRKGRYYVVHWSEWQGSRPSAEWVSEQEAARWLIHNDRELPEDLAHLRDEVEQ